MLPNSFTAPLLHYLTHMNFFKERAVVAPEDVDVDILSVGAGEV